MILAAVHDPLPLGAEKDKNLDPPPLGGRGRAPNFEEDRS